MVEDLKDMLTEKSEIIDEILAKKLKMEKELKNKVLANLQADLKKWEEGKIEKIPEEKMAEAEKNYNLNKNNFKKIKKICIDIVDVFCENMELKRIDFMVCLL